MNKFLSAIVAFFEFIGKVITILIAKLFLFIPLAYALIFFIICLCSKSNVSDYNSEFIIGLVISTVVAVVLSIMSLCKKITKKRAKKEKPNVVTELKQVDSNEQAGLDKESKSVVDKINEKLIKAEIDDLNLLKPKIFRTRLDASMLIYEFSDRLVFYRKTENGLEHIATEHKENKD